MFLLTPLLARRSIYGAPVVGRAVFARRRNAREQCELDLTTRLNIVAAVVEKAESNFQIVASIQTVPPHQWMVAIVQQMSRSALRVCFPPRLTAALQNLQILFPSQFSWGGSSLYQQEYCR
jgi:hypothetical protein